MRCVAKSGLGILVVVWRGKVTRSAMELWSLRRRSASQDLEIARSLRPAPPHATHPKVPAASSPNLRLTPATTYLRLSLAQRHRSPCWTLPGSTSLSQTATATRLSTMTNAFTSHQTPPLAPNSKAAVHLPRESVYPLSGLDVGSRFMRHNCLWRFS